MENVRAVRAVSAAQFCYARTIFIVILSGADGGKLGDRYNYYKRARLSTNKSQTVRAVETQAACGAGRLEESDLFD